MSAWFLCFWGFVLFVLFVCVCVCVCLCRCLYIHLLTRLTEPFFNGVRGFVLLYYPSAFG